MVIFPLAPDQTIASYAENIMLSLLT